MTGAIVPKPFDYIIPVEKVKYLKDGKVVRTRIAENEYSFECSNCGMVIEIDGHIEFENRYDKQ